jgi:hypothetical protein
MRRSIEQVKYVQLYSHPIANHCLTQQSFLVVFHGSYIPGDWFISRLGCINAKAILHCAINGAIQDVYCLNIVASYCSFNDQVFSSSSWLGILQICLFLIQPPLPSHLHHLSLHSNIHSHHPLLSLLSSPSSSLQI